MNMSTYCEKLLSAFVLGLFSLSVLAAELPDWWPEDLTVPSTATLTKVDEAKEKGLPEVEFSVPIAGTTAEALIDASATELEGKGWTIDQRRQRSTSDSVTATRRDIDKRVIVTAWKPGTIFNKQKDAFRLEVKVYRSVP